MSNKKKLMTRFLWIFPCLLATGCVSTILPSPVVSPPPVTLAPQPAGQGWWSIRFRMDRPEDQTRWDKDLFIAHRIVAPLLGNFRAEIELWRFHRRAANDEAGHQFSFLFYSAASVADRINQRVVDDPLVKHMLSSGMVREVLAAPIDHNDRPQVGDTSDPKWSLVMKDNWPYYIMGVSRMWLGMIDQVSREIGNVEAPTQEELLGHYKQVNTEVTRIWQQEGYHALLHHLNAIYGYEAMVYWEKRWKSF